MRILLGITGGIAAYKAANLIRAFSEQGHIVQALPTQNALRFIGKATLEALSGSSIDNDMYQDVHEVRHVELGANADLIVVAPATANFLAKLANGIADDLLMNAILASTSEIYVCPAMHTEMWQNPATQANVSTLRARGINVMEPASGRLTGTDTGPGRLPETEEILSFVMGKKPLIGLAVTVTAGGTREPIDQVRYIGNSSSGRMGIAIATAYRDAGALVRLVACNIELPMPAGIEVVRASSVADLDQAMNNPCEIMVMAAAVSDFQIDKPFEGKLPRGEASTITLVPTKDLIADFAVKNPDTFCLAFALTEDGADVEAISQGKLLSKKVSAVAGNSISSLGSETSEITLVTKLAVLRESGTKIELGRWLVGAISKIMSRA
ncbi:phosphopantothenate---cysteine ligase [Candidatus Aquiluna sp. IMCC13023]|uniref:bifunctional phosphopantothenoylcysteine decarboxylase/phosphopantothenate--cysteine ligase CoaBC n=1 Tax=Candidatus Aquiluna sp. IMCC13023 TaxID=1081644 RepID=UPI00025B1BC4|nr:bifunctional phosphopantothenoylcysteine decarboxylase/phosphopantothenate--cysteine ligase CoaBC [Candidatus Aquiluna sp. IMCC13023]EIC91342.1 phosphopantothenate---cysteine ligase [Candidatus Aquiluna sp. IMCC13023]